MVKVTSVTTEDGTAIMIGEYRLVMFTPTTDADAVAKFHKQAEDNAATLYLVCAEYARKVKWNQANLGKGKNWPVFSKRERLVNTMCKRAGIVDT